MLSRSKRSRHFKTKACSFVKRNFSSPISSSRLGISRSSEPVPITASNSNIPSFLLHPLCYNLLEQEPSQYLNNPATENEPDQYSKLPICEASNIAHATLGFEIERQLHSDHSFTSEVSNNPNIIETDPLNFNQDANDLKLNLAEWVANSKCPGMHVNSLLRILRPFHPQLPKDCRTLCCCPRTNPVIDMLDGKYLHIGLKQCLYIFLEKNAVDHDILIDIGIDGVGTNFSSSSGSTLWPILINVVGYCDVMMVATYFGTSKPKDVNIYLEPFTNELKNVLQNGFEHKGKNYTVNIRALVCDAPARAFVLNIKTFSGYYSCSKCHIKGRYLHHSIIFPYELCALRTDAEFISKRDTNHFLDENPTRIQDLGIGCVSNVPIDYMHNVCLGVMKQLMNLWINKRLKEYSLSLRTIEDISQYLLSIAKQMPDEFSRNPRPLFLLKRYKATEFRQLLLYTLPVLLKDKMPNIYYNHFLKLHCAIKILCMEGECCYNNELAEKLLNDFVMKFADLYDEHTLSFNVHSLLHLSTDVKKFKAPLDSFSAFKFENHLQYLKKLAQKNQQLANISVLTSKIRKYPLNHQIIIVCSPVKK